jgi:hypothetical protein
MLEPVRPSARRRVRRAITSTPLRLLRRILEDRNFSAFNSVPRDTLTEEEQAVYEFVGQHYHRHQSFPTETTLEERRIQLPEAPEPLAFYRDALVNQVRIRQGADVIMRLQDAIEQDDGEEIATVLSERRELIAQSTMTAVDMQYMQTTFLQSLEPMNSLRAIVGTGIVGLDDEVGGLKRGDLGVIAARPGVGKTYLQIAGAMHLALAGERVLAITKEMSEEQYVHRILCMYYGLDPSLGVQRRVSTRAYREVEERLREGLPERLLRNIIIPNSLDIRTTGDVQAAIRQYSPDLTDVDGTYFLRPVERKSFSSETERLAQLVRELREGAQVTRTAMLATWQQNRSKIVGTEGLYGTDALSQDASLVVMVRRHRDDPSIRVANVTKNRHGPEDFEIGLTFSFKPTNIGLRAPIPTREAAIRQGRDAFIAETVRTQPGTQPRRVEVPE